MEHDTTQDVVSEAAVEAAVEATGEATGEAIEVPEIVPMLREGETRFGVTAAGGPLGSGHWLADSSVCGDQVMALPVAVLVAGRTKASGSKAVDMCMFLDAIIEGAARLCGTDGIVESASLPAWVVARLFGTFPVLRQVYDDAMDQMLMTVEAAAYKAAIGGTARHVRKLRKKKTDSDGVETLEESEETLDKVVPPDPALSKLILTSRMKERYRDDEKHTQAVQINVIGPEANL